MTDTKETSDLLPCPFCGKVPEEPVDATRILGVWRLTHRGCYLPIFAIEGDTRADVIDKWNRRAPTPEAAALILAKEALAKIILMDRLHGLTPDSSGRHVWHNGRNGAVAQAALDAIDKLAEGAKPCPKPAPVIKHPC